MNILIVGNGFDLSHYLPTKYDHFMMAMGAIEKWDIANGEMSFDNLFRSLYEKEDYFFGYTKAMYKTNEIKISVDQIKELKIKLKENVWFRFFLHHVNNIETWIDFESEFANALDLVAIFSEKAERIYQFNEKLEELVLCRTEKEQNKYILFKEKSIQKLFLLGILDSLVENTRNAKINRKYYRNNKLDLDINSHLIIEDLERNLNNFIKLFDWYLVNIVENLKLINKANEKVFSFDFQELDILSFNYTRTLNRFYTPDTKIEFIHGRVGKSLVLGISDLKNEFLKKFKNYSFTKYHQKLLNNTDYLFLRENKKLMSLIDSNSIGQKNINIYIWGHSLAESDESYINEIFSFNQKPNVQCLVTVYFHGNDAPRLLNNLLDILKKDKVELWMKKGWLKFQENPNIAEINGIEPVELPKIAEA